MHIPVMRVVVKVFCPAWSFMTTRPKPPEMELKCCRTRPLGSQMHRSLQAIGAVGHHNARLRAVQTRDSAEGCCRIARILGLARALPGCYTDNKRTASAMSKRQEEISSWSNGVLNPQ